MRGSGTVFPHCKIIGVPAAFARMPQRGVRKGSFANIRFADRRCVVGGYLKKELPVESRLIDDQVWVKMSTQDDWLCKLVADAARGLSPLKNCNFFNLMVEAVESADEAPALAGADVDPMADLDEAPVLEALLAPRGRQARKKVPASRVPRGAAKREADPVGIRMPLTYGSTDRRDLRVVVGAKSRGNAKQRSFWLSEPDVPWALEYLQAEVSMHGVAAPEGVDEHNEPGLQWDMANSKYVLRLQDRVGGWSVHEAVVPRKRRQSQMPLNIEEYAEAKQKARERLHALSRGPPSDEE